MNLLVISRPGVWSRLAQRCLGLAIFCAIEMGPVWARPIPHNEAVRLVRASQVGQSWQEIHKAPLVLSDEQADGFAENCLQVGEVSTAFRFFRELEQRSPGSYYLFRCGVAAEKLGKRQLARKYFLEAGRTTGDPAQEAERSLALERLGRKVQPAADLHKDRGIVLLSVCLQPEAAVGELKLAVQAEPGDKDLTGLRGYAEILAGRYPEAVRDYQRSSLKYPANYAWALYLNGQTETADRVCVEDAKTPGSSLHTRARIALDRGQPQQALIYLNRVLKEQTQNPFYYAQRAEVLRELKRFSEASEDLSQAAELRRLPKRLPRLRSPLGAN